LFASVKRASLSQQCQKVFSPSSQDNESSCTIPEFVHSIAAQLTQNPNMTHYNRLVSSNHHLQQVLSYPSCLSDPSKAFVEGILEPLKLLRSQGKFPHQRSLILVPMLQNLLLS
jgi:hypothetical protein